MSKEEALIIVKALNPEQQSCKQKSSPKMKKAP